MNKDKTDTEVFCVPLPRKVIRKIFTFLSTDSNSPHSTFHSTPYQPQTRIHWVDFKILLSVSRVSKGWYDSVTRFLVRANAFDFCGTFSSLNASDPRYLSTILGVNTLLRRCTQVHCVCLRNCTHTAISTLNQLAESHSDTLMSLFLEGCAGFNDSILYTIATTFPKLTFLDVSRTSVTEDGLCEYLKVQDFAEGICTTIPYSSNLVDCIKVILFLL